MAVLNILLLFVFLQNCQFFGLWIIKNWLKKFMQVEVDVKCMQTFCWRGLSGFRDFAPFCLPSNLVKFPFWTMDFSPWGQKILDERPERHVRAEFCPRVRIINKRNATALQFFLKMYFNITLTSYNSWIHYTPNYAQPLLLPTKGMAKSGRKATESGRVRLIYEYANIAPVMYWGWCDMHNNVHGQKNYINPI